MSDQTFGKPKCTKPMHLVDPVAASALSLQKVSTSTTPTNLAKNPSDRPPPPVTPVRLLESVRQAATPPPPVNPPLTTISSSPPLLQEANDDPPPVFDINDEKHDSDAFVNNSDWSDIDDGFGFLDTSQFQINAADLTQAIESSILDATSTTPAVESNASGVDTSASTIQLSRPVTVASDVAQCANDAPHNFEADLGAPDNLMGTKRAKRIRALERETQNIRTTVEKMQRMQDAMLSQCLAAAKSEANEQLKEIHFHWCKLLGFDMSDMSPRAIESTLQRFRTHQDQQEQFVESPNMEVGAGDEGNLIEDWMKNDLFGGAHVR